MGWKTNIVFVLFLIFSTESLFASGGRNRARRIGAIQNLGTIRKAQELYASENNRNYTQNLFDLAKYTNVTNLLQGVANGEITIELSKDKQAYTAMATARDVCSCVFAATTSGISFVRKSEKCMAFDRKKAILKYVIFIGFLVFLCFSYKNRNSVFLKEAFAAVILLIIFIALILQSIIFEFTQYNCNTY